MNENISSDEQIQRIYNNTKNLRSPTGLDDMILGKIRALEEEPAPAANDKWWVYGSIAASIFLMFMLQFQGEDTIEIERQQPIEMAQLPVEEKEPPKLKEMKKQQLPQLFFQRTEDINGKIVRACNGTLAEPEENQNTLETTKKSNNKRSVLPIKLIYPNDAAKKTPDCERVSSEIFKQ